MRDQRTRGLRLSFFIAVISISQLLSATCVSAQEQSLGEVATPNLSHLVRSIIVEATKEGFVDEKHWNKTATRFDGLKFRGFKISKRKKKVRHGFCRKYAASLINPDQTFTLDIQEFTVPNEDVIAFSIQAKLKARCEATFAHYTYGVKGLNGTLVSDADIKVRLIISFDPQTEFSLAEPIPRIQMNAKVRDVDFWLKDIDVRRVGAFRGKGVELVGDGLEDALEELLQTQESRVKKKMQKELDKIQGSISAKQ